MVPVDNILMLLFLFSTSRYYDMFTQHYDFYNYASPITPGVISLLRTIVYRMVADLCHFVFSPRDPFKRKVEIITTKMRGRGTKTRLSAGSRGEK